MLENFYNYFARLFTSDRLDMESDGYRIARAQSALIGLCLFFLSAFATFYYILGFYVAVFSNLYLFTFAIITGIILKITDLYEFTGNILAFLGYTGFSADIIASGGIYSPIVPWLIVVPVYAYLYANLKSGIVWLIITFISILAYAVLDLVDIKFPFLYHRELAWLFYGYMYSGLIIFIALFIALYENHKKNVINKIENTKNALWGEMELAKKFRQCFYLKTLKWKGMRSQHT